MNLPQIRNKIFIIRNQSVILDFDLAELYSVETKHLNYSVKRNLKRFPEDFMFQLTRDEWEILRSQNVTSSYGGRRYLPYAFTEQGVAMLSGILRSDIAIEMNIAIMRTFVTLRQTVIHLPQLELISLKTEIERLKQYLEEVFADYNDINEDTRIQLELINQTIAELQYEKNVNETKTRPKIGF